MQISSEDWTSAYAYMDKNQQYQKQEYPEQQGANYTQHYTHAFLVQRS